MCSRSPHFWGLLTNHPVLGTLAALDCSPVSKPWLVLRPLSQVLFSLGLLHLLTMVLQVPASLKLRGGGPVSPSHWGMCPSHPC